MASPAIQILAQAQGFQQQFAQAKNNLSRMTPSAQEDVPSQLEQTAVDFSALQEKVEKYLRQQGTIPGASRNQVDAVCQALTAAAADLEIIDTNSKTAAQYGEIAAKVSDLYSAASINQSQVASLEQRITNLTKYPHLNRGNREAYEVLTVTLQSYHPQSNGTGHNPSSVFAPDADRRGTIGSTDEAFEVSLLLDQFKELETKLCQDPIKDFETVLPYYRELKKYSLSHPSFVSQNAKQTIAAKLEETEKLLQQCIDTQANIEKPQVQKAQAQADKEKAEAEKVKALTECYSEIVTVAASTSGGLDLSKVNTAYAKLQREDKTRFILSLRDVLKKPIALVQQSNPISQIPGDWTQKREAMQKMIPAQTRATVTNLDLKGPSMIAKFNEVKNMQPPPVRTPSSSATTRQPAPSSQPHSYPSTPQPIYYPPSSRYSSSRTTDFPSGMYLPDGVDIADLHLEDVPRSSTRPQLRHSQPVPPLLSTDFPGMYLPAEIDISDLHLEDVQPSSTQASVGIPFNMEAIHKLQALAVSLETNGSSDDLAQVCHSLQIMESEEHKCPFKITDKQTRLIGDRPNYHLFLIHKNETPEKIVKDPQYGNKAFAGIYPATNEERRRSVQRTIVELVLENLEDAINFESGEQAIEQNLKILNEVKLDAKDCPQDKGNIPHLLAEFFYKMHKANRQFDKSLIDPDMPQFKDKFGEDAFPKSFPGTGQAKISAIGLVRNALKTTWKVE